ncbi:MAG TPA: hypothetical protein VF297_22940 [Pyrinomonadaceae bacterium]
METTARRSRETYFTAAFVLLTLCLLGPATARAQWTTPDASGNINNTNTGNVGVGTTTPTNAKVQIDFNDGAASGEHTIVYGSRSGTSSGGIKFGYRADGTNITGGFIRSLANLPFFIGTTGSPQALTISDAGLVGIGTTNPTRLLELAAPSTNTQVFMASNAALSVFNTNTTANNTADLSFRTFDSAGAGITPAKVVAVFTNRTANASAGDLSFVTMNAGSAAERMRVTAAGNVGIGTANPLSKLHVVDGNHLAVFTTQGYGSTFTKDGLTVIANPDAGYSSMVINSAHSVVTDRGLLRLFRNDGISPQQEMLYVRMDGRVGLGTLSPGYRLDVQGGQVNASGGLCIAGDCKTAWSQVTGGTSQWTTSGTAIHYTGGNVGIGNASPTSRLHVGGQADNLFSVSSTGSAATDTVASFSSAIGNILAVRGNGYVGVGTTTPVRGFHISGPNASGLSEFVLENTGMPANNRKFNLWGSNALGASGRFFFRVLNDAGNATTRDLMSFDNATGNIGVGTNAPTSLLEVGRNQPTGTELKVSNYDAAGFSGLYLDSGFAQGAGGFVQWNNTTNANNMFVATGGAAPLHLGTNNTSRMTILPTSGNVGINTTGPQAKLDVRAGGSLAAGPNTALWSPTNTADANTSYVHWGTTGDWYIRPGTTSGKVIMADNGGNIGVGTTSPGAGYKVDVVGNVNSSGLCIAGDCKTAWSQVGGGNPSQWTTSGTNVFYNGGNIGIGNSAPGSQLFIGSGTPPIATLPGINVALGPSSGAYVTATNNTTSTFMGSDGSPYGIVGTLTNHPLGFRANNTLAMSIMPSGYVGIGTSAPSAKLQIISVDDTVAPAFSVRQDNNALYGFDITLDTNVNGNLTFHRVNNGTQANVITLDRVSGKVGVGTASPTEALDVVGNIKATGSVSATYQDVAEWVPSSQKLAPGTVVILDAGKTNHVIASGSAYDTKVAGVVSAEPGVILGVGGDDKLKVATTGRVKVKVDASRGAIKVGDLLVTSGVEGVAMKSVPVDLGGVSFHRPGTIIGKALEPLEKGTGEILVLLSLQ